MSGWLGRRIEPVAALPRDIYFACRQAQLRLASLGRAPTAPIDPDIVTLAIQNMAGFTRLNVTRAALLAEYRSLNDRRASFMVLAIDGQRVTRWRQPSIPVLPHLRKQFAFRKACYHELIRQTLRWRGLSLRMVVAIDVSDLAYPSAELPVFAFQKREGIPNILLPDIDFMLWLWYAAEQDRLAYADKAIRAGFVGSSTGGPVTCELATPRLKLAAHFVGNPRVDFTIAQAVQHKTEAARELLASQPYFGPRQSWDRQRRHRFLLSIDGNGATCSRLALALKSNSVLVKFASQYRLYYFDRLVAGRDYLPVEGPADIEAILDREEASPGHYAPVAAAGTAFYAKYLTRPAVLDYTAALIARCAVVQSALG